MLLIKLIRDLGLENQVSIINVPYEEMPGIYRKADIYVAPSKSTPTWQEQYNTTLLEAQASGLPIVTTISGGIPENVGGAAILVEPGNADKLAYAIKSLILNPKMRSYLAEKARNRAVRVHDISHGAGKLTRVYNQLLSEK